jgi:hypothetical protein
VTKSFEQTDKNPSIRLEQLNQSLTTRDGRTFHDPSDHWIKLNRIEKMEGGLNFPALLLIDPRQFIMEGRQTSPLYQTGQPLTRIDRKTA